MSTSIYIEKFTLAEVLDLFQRCVYHADLETGSIFRRGRLLRTYMAGKRYGTARTKRPIIVLAVKPKRIHISVARIIWMVGTQCVLPDDFEIHHRDEDPANNAFGNLFALHRVDHQKLHHGWLLPEPDFDPADFDPGDHPF